MSNATEEKGARDARRVLIAWIVAAQLLVFPCMAFSALTVLVATPLRLEYWAPLLAIAAVSVLIEAGAAWLCAERLRDRLRDRLRFSPRVVALASSLGLLAGAVLAGLLGKAVLEIADIPMEPMLLVPIAAACLVSGSALGTLLGCRYRAPERN